MNNGGNTLKARMLMILAMAIFGTIGLFAKFIPVTSGELALYRAVLAVILIGVFLLIKREPLHLKELGKSLWITLISGMAIGFNWVLLFTAYKYTTISLATLSYYCAPILVTILSPVIYKEKLTKKGIFCFIMATLGLVLIIGVTGAGGSSHITGILFGLGAAVLYAGIILCNKGLGHIPGIQRTFIQFVGAVIVMLPYVLIKEGGFHLNVLDTKGWIMLLVAGFVHTGIVYCIYFSVMNDLSGQEVSILGYIDPLVACIISAVFLKEGITGLQIVGGVMILGFTLLNEINLKTLYRTEK